MLWSSEPHATGTTTIEMTAVTATDDGGGVVEYYFECVFGGTNCDDSGWQPDDPSYTASNLEAGTAYTFRVRARDLFNNVTLSSSSVEATTDPGGPGATSVTVTDIVYGGHGGRFGNKHLDVTLAVEDDGGAPVEGASVSVTINFDGGVDSTSDTGLTDVNGEVGFTWSSAPSGDCFNTVVTGVTAAGLTWDTVVPPNSYCP
jgi:hypothetical protein